MRTAIIAAIVAMLVSAASATAAFVVTSKSIKNGTIQLVDISPQAKKALRGQRGPQGPQGIQAITEVQGPQTVVPPGQTGSAFAPCPEGQQAIAGGYEAFSAGVIGSPGTAVTVSRRSSRGWDVQARNFSLSGTGSLTAYAYCSPNVTLLP